MGFFVVVVLGVGMMFGLVWVVVILVGFMVILLSVFVVGLVMYYCRFQKWLLVVLRIR